MKKNNSVISVVIAGLGGQGVITVSDILAETLFKSGFDVKKSEIHGMSQRGGSVTSDIRFGTNVHSPTVPVGEADYLLLINEDQLEKNRSMIKPNGLILSPAMIDTKKLPNARSINLAVLGMLAAHLSEVAKPMWEKAIRRIMPEKLHDAALPAFAVGFSTAGDGNSRVSE